MPSRNERIERKAQLLEQLDSMREVDLEGNLKAQMLSLGWRFPFARVFSSRRPVTLVLPQCPAQASGEIISPTSVPSSWTLVPSKSR